jgi:hypothetical protein
MRRRRRLRNADQRVEPLKSGAFDEVLNVPIADPRAGIDSEAPNRQPIATYDPHQFGNH